jgi:uncharacterized protein (DUF488 family)
MIFTVGHSTRPEKEFLQLLKQYGIKTLIDIRTVPRSRWNPQFNRTNLEKTIPKAGMQYLHVPELGGLRQPSPDSKNLALENAGLRGYADHMQTPQFDEALMRVIELGTGQNVALMCAEASYAKCHRQLTSDALTARKVSIRHILDTAKAEPHVLTPFARLDGDRVSYPLDQSRLDF